MASDQARTSSRHISWKQETPTTRANQNSRMVQETMAHFLVAKGSEVLR
ncbi:MAG: hypothetical protein ACD_75C00445G0002 [uncultured bacterium]|nr:MAG: hypothetical protein ACD_75C00445G0002 [uncultured bacterium]